MRVFDFEGMLEGMAELKTELESTTSLSEEESSEQEANQVTDTVKLPRSTVPDSQAPEDSDDELLMSTPFGSPTKNTMNNEKPASSAAHVNPEATEQQKPNHMLLLSSLSTIFSPLQRANYTAATSQLTTFLRSLRHTTLNHNLLTLVMNSTQQPYTHNPAKPAPRDNNPNVPNVTTHTEPTQGSSPSIFPSCTSIPSLGKTLSYLVDTHLLVHSVPKSVADARKVSGKGSSQVMVKKGMTAPGRRSDSGAGFVCCVEVLSVRTDAGVGGFGFFDLDGRGGVRDVF